MNFTNMTRRVLLVVTLAAGLTLAAPYGFAQSAESLRASGQAGERWDGYLEARDASAKAEVDQINAQRKDLYAERAKQQGISVEEVGKVYAQQIFDKLAKGSWFMQPNGQWIQK
jgi:uncharacterized protein YdbL (DUF1318 family)